MNKKNTVPGQGALTVPVMDIVIVKRVLPELASSRTEQTSENWNTKKGGVGRGRGFGNSSNSPQLKRRFRIYW